MYANIVTVEPPTRESIDEKCGIVSAKNRTLPIMTVLDTSRFQVKSRERK